MKSQLLTPELALLHAVGDVDAVVLGAAVRQRLLQRLGVQHEAVVEAAGDVVHLRGGEGKYIVF